MYYHIDGDIKAGLGITSKCIFQFESNLGPLPSPACGGGLGAGFRAPLEVGGSVLTWGAVWPWEAAFPPREAAVIQSRAVSAVRPRAGPGTAPPCVRECACLYESDFARTCVPCALVSACVHAHVLRVHACSRVPVCSHAHTVGQALRACRTLLT